MIASRDGHACGKFQMGDQMVLIVAGGYQSISVEFLPINEKHWIRGDDSIHLIEHNFCKLIFLPGPSLPFEPHSYSHFIVSNSDSTYFIDTYNNRFLQLVCPSDLASCYWLEMDQKLIYPRSRPIVTLIPDSLTNCA